MNPIHWQSWVLLFLLVNVGAMLGPSFQDMKNIWPALIIFFHPISPTRKHRVNRSQSDTGEYRPAGVGDYCD